MEKSLFKIIFGIKFLFLNMFSFFFFEMQNGGMVIFVSDFFQKSDILKK